MYYPPVSFFFNVEFIGLDELTDNDIRFQEVSGINAEISTEELKEGGENRFVHKLPRPAKYNNLVLKRGMLTDSGLIDWFKNAVENFEFKPITIKVTLLDKEGAPLSSWNFVNAYPVKWNVSSFDAKKNEIVVDTIEIVYKYFSRL